MSEKEQVMKEKVEHSGIFNFAGFYSFAYSWFRDEQYDGVDEEKYAEKVSGNSRDIDIEWKAFKSMSDYFKIEQKLVFQIRDLTDVEVEIDGKKKKMNKGNISVEIKTTLVRDPESKWDRMPTLRFMRDVYNKYVIPGRVTSMKEKARENTAKFKEELKAYLELTGRRN